MTYEEVAERYEPLFRSLAKQTLKQYQYDSELDLEDLLQEARIAAWQCLENYCEDRGEFGAYLKTCVRNALITFCRSFLPHIDAPSVGGWNRVYLSHDIPERPTEESFDLSLAIAELESPYRDVVSLAAQGYNGIEIAERLGMKSQRVSEIKKEALVRLQSLLAT